jgi:hypothetical protein
MTFGNSCNSTFPLRALRLRGIFASRDAATRPAELARLYRTMEAADFSRDVLQYTNKLGAVNVLRSGWSDWGTPERVFASLAGTPSLRDLEKRLARRSDARRAALVR